MIREEDERFERHPFNELGEVIDLSLNVGVGTPEGVQKKELFIQHDRLAPTRALATLQNQLSYIYASYIYINILRKRYQGQIILHAKDLENCYFEPVIL